MNLAVSPPPPTKKKMDKRIKGIQPFFNVHKEQVGAKIFKYFLSAELRQGLNERRG